MPAYNTGIRYNTGARYRLPGQLKHNMSKVKLELQKLDDAGLAALAAAHKQALSTAPGNTVYTTPRPAPAVFDPILAQFQAKLAEINVQEKALEAQRGQRDALRAQLEAQLTIRAGYVQETSAGDEGKIGFSAFATQNEGSPTTSMPIPQNVKAVMGKKGEIKVSCKAVPKAKSYTWRCREHVEGQPAGAWANVKSTSTASFIVPNLTSGKTYAFSVMVLGPNNTESDWSDEAVCMAP